MFNIIEFIKRPFKIRAMKNRIRVNIIKQELKDLDAWASKKADDLNKFSSKCDNYRNSKCPNCQSTNVVKVFARFKGSISGSYQSEHIFGCGGGHGNVSGDFDTERILRCNECNNEWKPTERTHHYTGEVIERKVDYVRYFLSDYTEYNPDACEYDPDDVEEKYNSLEEKKNAYREKINTHWTLNKIRDFLPIIHQETLCTLAERKDKYDRENFYKHFNGKLLEKLGCNPIDYEAELKKLNTEGT